MSQENPEIFTVINTSLPRRSHSIIKRTLTALLAGAPDQTILDVGCADGMVGKLIGEGYRVTGVELNETLAAMARKRYDRVVEMDLDGGALPFEENAFDIIVATDVIEHCKYDEHVTGELFRVLKEGGTAIISLPNIAQIQFRLKLLFGRFDYEEAGVLSKDHYHLYTLRSLKTLLQNAGFSVTRVLGSGTLYSYVPFFKTLIAPQLIALAKKPTA